MVEIGWQSQQGKDLLLQGCAWGKMPRDGLGRVQHSQGDLLEGAQQAFGGGPCGGAGGLACVETGQRALLLGQAPPHSVFD